MSRARDNHLEETRAHCSRVTPGPIIMPRYLAALTIFYDDQSGMKRQGHARILEASPSVNREPTTITAHSGGFKWRPVHGAVCRKTRANDISRRREDTAAKSSAQARKSVRGARFKMCLEHLIKGSNASANKEPEAGSLGLGRPRET